MNEKKVYTTDDNIKSIMFSMKDMLKKMDVLIETIQSKSTEKNLEDKDLPF